MYHCNVCFYLIGESADLFKNLKEMPPLPHFTHEFAESLKPDETLAKQADVIVIDMSGLNIVGTLRILLSHRKKEAELIFLAQKEQMQILVEHGGSEITDIWTLPLSGKEIQFYFYKWQQSYKTRMDFWQNRNYLDTMIDSVPHLVWFKDKDGAHMKVNNFFCKAVNKTMEQIEGRGHYYIWVLTRKSMRRANLSAWNPSMKSWRKGKHACLMKMSRSETACGS